MKDNYEQDIPVKRVISNPAFGIGAKNLSTGKIALYAEHDIALMELASSARIDERTSPVCVDPGLSTFIEGQKIFCLEAQSFHQPFCAFLISSGVAGIDN